MHVLGSVVDAFEMANGAFAAQMQISTDNKPLLSGLLMSGMLGNVSLTHVLLDDRALPLEVSLVHSPARPKSKILCEPFLSKRNLYPKFTSKAGIKPIIMDVLTYCDGTNDYLDISKNGRHRRHFEMFMEASAQQSRSLVKATLLLASGMTSAVAEDKQETKDVENAASVLWKAGCRLFLSRKRSISKPVLYSI